jgi:hypothetical protein
MSEAGAFLSGFLLLYGSMAQACVRPLPIGATAHKSASMKDLFESPEALSWITWYYQFGGLGLGLLNLVMNLADVAGKNNERWETPIKYAESLGRYGGTWSAHSPASTGLFTPDCNSVLWAMTIEKSG